MRSDDDMAPIHYYLEKGHSLKDLLCLNYYEKAIYKASASLGLEEKINFYKILFGKY